MEMLLNVAGASLLGYLLGSIPFGLILTKAAGLGDVRQQGSGNIGATNVLRTGNKGLAAATLVLDLVKGFVPVWLAWNWFPDFVALTAFFAVFGHCYPVWLGFKGGKGVATAAGVAFGLAWQTGLIYAGLWLALLALLRISSVAGLVAALALLTAPLFSSLDGGAFVPLFLAVTVIYGRHSENIQRLRAGTEPKVGSKG